MLKKIYVVLSGMEKGCVHHDCIHVVAAHNEAEAIKLADVLIHENHIWGPSARQMLGLRHAAEFMSYYEHSMWQVDLPVQAARKLYSLLGEKAWST